ncbi:MAG: hypothetical protein JW741_24765, partial [Sedimentisphaerales bacterium]|nr:hypothetical protein [Sedimentisphaerales bacterium]
MSRATLAGEPPTKPVDPAMEKVCTEFAKKIEVTINASDPGPFNRAVDNKAIADAALRGFEVPEQVRTMVKVQFIGVNLGTTLVTECIRKGGSYKFLRLRVVDGEPRVLFRLLPGPTPDANYHEMRISGWKEGEPKVVDLYFANKGEWLTGEVRRSMLYPVTVARKENEGKLTASEKALLDASQNISGAEQAAADGKPADGLAALKALPASVRGYKHVLMLQVRLAAGAGDEELSAAAEEHRKAFPGDCWLELFLMDWFLGAKKYAEGLKAIDRLDGCLGGDPYLQVLRACVHNADGHREKAMECCRKAMADEPSMTLAHMVALPLLLEAKDYAQVARSLTVIEGASGDGPKPGLSREPAFSEFLKSEEGKRWMAAREAKAAPAEEPAAIPV